MLSVRNKKYIILSGLGALFFILIFVVLFPLFSAIKKNANEIINQKKQIILYEKRIQNFNTLATEYKEFQPNIAKINSIFIDSKEPLEFIDFLETTAETLGLSVDILINNNEAESNLSNLGFQITAFGSFDNLMKFLEKLESANYLVDINSLSVQKAPEGKVDSHGGKTQNDSVQINLDINVSARS